MSNSYSKKLLYAVLFSLFCIQGIIAQHSVARMWNEAQLTAIRKDFGRPTVQARNLWHVSLAMYDAWAVFNPDADTYLLGKTLNDFKCPFKGFPKPSNVNKATNEAIS